MSAKLPPAHVNFALVAAVRAAENQVRDDQGAESPAPDHESHHRGRAVGAPPRGARAFTSGGFRRSRPAPPPRRSGRVQVAIDAPAPPGSDEEVDDIDDDRPALRSQPVGAGMYEDQGSADSDSGCGGGSGNDGERRARAFKVIKQADGGGSRLMTSATAAVSAPVSWAASGAGASRNQATLLQWVGSLRERLVTTAPARALGTAPSTVALAMQMARDWKKLPEGPSPGAPATLSEVRELLMRSASSAPGGPTGKPPPLWLPVFLLNLSRPRTPAQQDLADERLGLCQAAAQRGKLSTGG